MVADTLKSAPDYLGALEFKVGAFHKSINRMGGLGVFEFNITDFFHAAIDPDDPYCGSQCPTGTSAEADTPCKSRRHYRMHVGHTHLLS